MAELIGVASGVAGLCTFAFQGGTTLYNTIKSYQSHQQRVLDLLDENGALNGVLETLQRTLASACDLDLSALEIPLTRCGVACQEFTKEIETMSSVADGSFSKFRGWARLRYMGEDIDGFRRLLAGYKTTITVALADANLQRSALTSERIEGYSQMIQTATADFEERLERIDETLERLVHRTVEDSANTEVQDTAAELKQIQEERLSTEKCLQICAQLSEHIGQLRLAGRPSGDRSTWTDADSFPERITNEGLDECEESLSRMAQRLAQHEKTLFTRLKEKMEGSSLTGRNAREVARLRDEWESTRRQMDVLVKAERKLEETVSVIRNHATGNAIQVMVSVDGKPLRGTNEATGAFAEQLGGLMSNETVQASIQEMARMRIATFERSGVEDEGRSRKNQSRTSRHIGTRAEGTSGHERGEPNGEDSPFEDLYGEGHTLECESPTGSTRGKRRQ